MKADGFDGAIIGVAHRADGFGPVIAYDYIKCVDILMRDQEMTHEEATDWMDFNVICAWVGDGTPIFIYSYDEDSYETL